MCVRKCRRDDKRQRGERKERISVRLESEKVNSTCKVEYLGRQSGIGQKRVE